VHSGICPPVNPLWANRCEISPRYILTARANLPQVVGTGGWFDSAERPIRFSVSGRILWHSLPRDHGVVPLQTIRPRKEFAKLREVVLPFPFVPNIFSALPQPGQTVPPACVRIGDEDRVEFQGCSRSPRPRIGKHGVGEWR